MLLFFDNIGDGQYPRTGALFASMFPPCTAISVDPLLHSPDALETFYGLKLESLHVFPKTVEKFLEEDGDGFLKQKSWKRVAVVAVHSHAAVENYVPHVLRDSTDVPFIFFALPCCKPQYLKEEIMKEFNLTMLDNQIDLAVHTTQRTVIRYVK